MKPIDFIKAYKPFAEQTEKEKGIHNVFTLAQAALESAWGESAPGNMFFGVKAGKNTPKSQKQLLRTREVFADEKQSYRFPEVISITKRSDGKYLYQVRDWFRKYETPGECFSDHADFFYKNKRYAAALEVKNDPHAFADEIAKAGYATAPTYARDLKNVIESIEKIIKEEGL